jgi:hypothetical protein
MTHDSRIKVNVGDEVWNGTHAFISILLFKLFSKIILKKIKNKNKNKKNEKSIHKTKKTRILSTLVVEDQKS